VAETYNIFMAIRVTKTVNDETIVDEENHFNNQSFARMANLADEFYTLVEKLQKIK